MQIYYSHRYSVYLKQNGTVSSFSVLSIFHSESYNFAHENHNCPFCSPAFFLKIFYQPGHYNVPGRVLSTGFMVKFIVNPGKILCFTKVDVYVAAFALIVSMKKPNNKCFCTDLQHLLSDFYPFYSFLKYITISYCRAKDYSAWSFRYSSRPSS